MSYELLRMEPKVFDKVGFKPGLEMEKNSILGVRPERRSSS